MKSIFEDVKIISTAGVFGFLPSYLGVSYLTHNESIQTIGFVAYYAGFVSYLLVDALYASYLDRNKTSQPLLD